MLSSNTQYYEQGEVAWDKTIPSKILNANDDHSSEKNTWIESKYLWRLEIAKMLINDKFRSTSFDILWDTIYLKLNVKKLTAMKNGSSSGGDRMETLDWWSVRIYPYETNHRDEDSLPKELYEIGMLTFEIDDDGEKIVKNFLTIEWAINYFEKKIAYYTDRLLKQINVMEQRASNALDSDDQYSIGTRSLSTNGYVHTAIKCKNFIELFQSYIKNLKVLNN